jgi:ribose transport system substrate-binding protein
LIALNRLIGRDGVRLSSGSAPRWCLLVALLALLAPGCGRDDPGAEDIRVHDTGPRKLGVLLPYRGGDLMSELELGIRETAEKAEYTMEQMSADNDAAAQLSQLDQLLARKVDAVLLVPVDGGSLAPALGKARAADVPLFTAHRAIPGALPVSHTASDDYGAGWLAAEYLATWFQGQAIVGVVGSTATPWTAERERGFRDALRQHRGMSIVAAADGGGGREGAQAAAAALLQGQRDIKAIFAASASMALGVLDAAQARGRMDLIVVAQEANADVYSAIRSDSPIKATLAERPRDVGRRAVEWITAHFADQPVPPLVLVPVRLVNVDSLGGPVTPPPPAGSVPERSADTLARR